MVISQPAVICLEATADHVRRLVAALFGGRKRRSGRLAAAEAVAVPPPEPVAVRAGASRLTGGETAAALSAPERRARAAALRGLLLARQRRFAGAEAAFGEALRLDPAFDPTTIPTFWELERGAHEAVVGAFLAADRPRDAALLSARLRRTYRPSLVRTRSSESREPALG